MSIPARKTTITPFSSDNKIYLIVRADLRAGLRRTSVHVEMRLDGSLAMGFRNVYVTECVAHQNVEAVRKPAAQEEPVDEQPRFH